MKYNSFVFVGLLLCACTGTNKIKKDIAKKTNNDSSAVIHSLTENTNRDYVVYITPNGKKLLLKKDVPETDTLVSIAGAQPHIEANIMEANDNAGTVGSHGGADDLFTGSVRPTVKTTYSTATYETYATIAALYRNLKPKAFMDNLAIGHSDARVTYENRNVKITTAYLYTITIESDNDFHLLIGNTPIYEPGTTRVFNAEIPGIPKNGTAAIKQHIHDLRAKLIRIFSAIPVCGNRGYLQEHTKITIKGSLFYDTQHKSNPAKCLDVEGESAWEIHPVYDITGLD